VSEVPAGSPLDLHLGTGDLAEGAVLVDVVDARGVDVWKGRAAIYQEHIEVMVPPITQKGPHFLRLYAPTQASSDGDLLREFAFQVK